MKKVFSLLLVVAMLVSMAVVASAAEPVQGMKHTITETDTDITVTITIGNVTNCSGFVSFLQTSAVTYVDGSAKVLDARFDTKTNLPTSSSLKFAYGMSTTDNYFDEAGEIVIAEYKVTKNDPTKPLSAADFTYGTNSIKASKVTTGTGGTCAGVAAGNNFTSAKQPTYFTVEYVDARTPDSPFNATAAGTTITCTGKVDATVENYGVVFTKESTVEGARAQKYYGAMPGDTVKDYYGSTTFDFGEWDGSFEIILEGVHAGEKELDFFVNDTVIENTNFTLNIAE